MKICNIVGCDSIIHAKYLCMKHYQKLIKYGDPCYKMRNMDHIKFCSIIDCSGKYYGLNLCKKHYDQKLYDENKGKRLKQHIKWFKNNPQKKKESDRKYHKNHPEVSLKANKKQLEKLGEYFDMSSQQYKYTLQAWSKTIKKRDKICQKCGSSSNLNTHHIQPKSEYPELSLDLDNGITLCEKCHEKMHGFKIY